MSKLLSYLLINYLKTIFKVILISYPFGIILNLFEEIEFFKNLDQNILMPLILTALYIPSEIIKMLPLLYLYLVCGFFLICEIIKTF